jgi:hypothetical protein
VSKIAINGRLALDEMQGPWEDSREQLVAALGDLQDGVIGAVNGNLSTRDNTTSDYDDYILTHNQVTRIKNPLVRGDKTIPVKGIWAARCVGVEMSGGKPTRKLYALSKPQIDWEPADSESSVLLVTARFPAPSGVCSAYRSAAHSLATAADVVFDTVEFEDGDLSVDTTTGKITCASAGIVLLTATISWAAAVNGQYRGHYLRNHTQASDFAPARGMHIDTGGANIAVRLSSAKRVSVNAGDQLGARVDHDSGGSSSLSVAAGNTTIGAHYVAPLKGTTGNVRLYFFGG